MDAPNHGIGAEHCMLERFVAGRGPNHVMLSAVLKTVIDELSYTQIFAVDFEGVRPGSPQFPRVGRRVGTYRVWCVDARPNVIHGTVMLVVEFLWIAQYRINAIRQGYRLRLIRTASKGNRNHERGNQESSHHNLHACLRTLSLMAEPELRTDIEGHIAPQIHPTAILAPGAIVIGQVTIEGDCFIGPNAVLRGDLEPIIIRRGSNIQDNCVIHTEKGCPVEIGPDVSVGHGAVIHGSIIKERALIGMNAVILNGAVVGEHAVVGALTLVPDNGEVPARSLAVGIPCRIIKENHDGVAGMAHNNTDRYHRYQREHLSGMWKTVTGPLNDNGTFTA